MTSPAANLSRIDPRSTVALSISTTSSARLPIASAAVKPRNRSAAGFQVKIRQLVSSENTASVIASSKYS